MLANGVVFVPSSCVILPQPIINLPGFQEDMITLCDDHSVKTPSVVFNIWERGNAGIQELREKLLSSVKLAVFDIIVELYGMQQPVASLSDEEVQRHLSPGLLSVEDDASTSTTQEATVNSELESDQNWQVKEKHHRLQECKDTLHRTAHMGLIGTLSGTYTSELPLLFNKCVETTSSVVSYHDWLIPSPFCTKNVLSYTYSVAKSYLAGVTLSIFQSVDGFTDILSYIAHDKLDDVVSKVSSVYFMVGRDLSQWKESRVPMDHTVHSDTIWQSSQIYSPLASWKLVNESSIPLWSVAKRQQMFIPRHRVLLIKIQNRKVSHIVIFKVLINNFS